MSAAISRPAGQQFLQLLVHWWSRVQAAIIRHKLLRVEAQRRQAADDLLFAGLYRLAAQREYADLIQCMDLRQERLLAQLAAVGTSDIRVRNEIDALHRIAQHDEQYGTDQHGQPHRFFDIVRVDDSLHLNIDFFAQRMCAPGSLHVPDFSTQEGTHRAVVLSRTEILELEVAPANRQSYAILSRMARTLLAGHVVWCGDVPVERDWVIQRAHMAANQRRPIKPLKILLKDGRVLLDRRR